MQLLALDAEFQPVAYLAYFNLQWTREYYEIGQFSVQIAAAAYKSEMAYLYTPDRPETGIIQKVELTETIKGRFVQLSGYFLEAILNDKVVYPTYYASGSIPATVVAMLRQYKEDIPLLTVADAPTVQGDGTSWQETGGQLATVAYTKLQTVQHSLRCRYDYQANTITAEVWQGLDRTQEQTVNPFVTLLKWMPPRIPAITKTMPLWSGRTRLKTVRWPMRICPAAGISGRCMWMPGLSAGTLPNRPRKSIWQGSSNWDWISCWIIWSSPMWIYRQRLPASCICRTGTWGTGWTPSWRTLGLLCRPVSSRCGR